MAAYKIAYGEVWMTNLATNSKPPFFSSDIRICAATDMMAIAYTENDDGDNVERILHKHGESAAVTAWADRQRKKLASNIDDPWGIIVLSFPANEATIAELNAILGNHYLLNGFETRVGRLLAATSENNAKI